MKFDEIRAANALAIVGAILYVACLLLVNVTPGFYRGMAGAWMHGWDISAFPMRSSPVGFGLYGLITWTAVSWGVGYLFAWVYNKLGKK